ncbi:hypothetical protein RRF57_012802 [Xylaria bambusicola]|uniref:Uncharacterized protein n=1 Tax=Xylaria bambusicola TaxID=326684 RepID=A0AAN7UQK1_9PEZI
MLVANTVGGLERDLGLPNAPEALDGTTLAVVHVSTRANYFQELLQDSVTPNEVTIASKRHHEMVALIGSR